MKIAVTSQNKKTITGHAGKCRRFWIFDIEEKKIKSKEMLEISTEEMFHGNHSTKPHPLDIANVFITESMGMGLQTRLQSKNILPIITKETDPEKAVEKFLDGSIYRQEPHNHHGNEHSHC
jgi:predicted Fe-Mo cluster-binding NifX family protein